MPGEALPPGSTIGILGGGQLGRMLAIAAARLGFRVHVFEPETDCPAAQVANRHVAARFDDAPALEMFAHGCDVVTFEWENVPVAAARTVAAIVPLRPGVEALAHAQDRVEEKRFLRACGVGTAGFATADDPPTLLSEADALGFPGILKTRRLGYDGKGQARVDNADALSAAVGRLGGAHALIYEELVPFRREISVIAARDLQGGVHAFDPAENVHSGGILRTSRVPAGVGVATVALAVAAAGRILDALDYRGVICVEFFVVGAGRSETLLANEIAPRVHNSGHWTMDGCACSQFEAHVRAIAGWPVPDLRRHGDVVMENLIGADVDRWPTIAAEDGAALHLYGKADTRPGRKMGHVNRVTPRRGGA